MHCKLQLKSELECTELYSSRWVCKLQFPTGLQCTEVTVSGRPTMQCTDVCTVHSPQLRFSRLQSIPSTVNPDWGGIKEGFALKNDAKSSTSFWKNRFVSSKFPTTWSGLKYSMIFLKLQHIMARCYDTSNYLPKLPEVTHFYRHCTPTFLSF